MRVVCGGEPLQAVKVLQEVITEPVRNLLRAGGRVLQLDGDLANSVDTRRRSQSRWRLSKSLMNPLPDVK